jgi:hypothetical protein
MPPNDDNGYVPGFNGMHMQAGMMAPPIMPIQPMGPSAGQMAMQLQHQAMAMQYVTPPPSQLFGGMSPAMPGMFSPRIPQQMLGRANWARQSAAHEQNEAMGMAQGGLGLGARVLGMGVAGLMGGPLGMLAYEGLGMGQMMQNGASSMMNPFIAQRARGLNIQNMSTGFVTGGANLAANGQGLNMMASQQVAHGITAMADSSSFRKDTGGAFNRADLDRITRLSGELGMLDQSQSADNMIREVKKVSKALSAFMKIAEEPDVQRAMQQMARFRGMGFATPEIPMAASNARTFARMAGVSMEAMNARGELGAGVFQQHGMSGAAGFNAGIASAGAARAAATGMTERQLAMAGGESGIASTMLNASAQAATMDAFLPAMVTRRNGRMVIDHNAMREMLSSGTMTPADLARRGGENIQRLGGRSAVDELLTRRRELQDEMATSMSPQQMTLLPMLQARMIQRTTGGSMTAAFRTMGMSEQDARTMSQTMQDPEFTTNMRQQLVTSSRERMAGRRDRVQEADSTGARIGALVDRNITAPSNDRLGRIMRPVTDYFAMEQDNEEALELAGDGRGRVVRGNRLGSEVQQSSARDRLRDDPSGMNAAMQDAMRRAGMNVARENMRDEHNQGDMIMRQFQGAHGFGFSRAARGGDTARSVIMGNAGTLNRIDEFFGNGPSAAAVVRLGEQQAELGSILEGRGGTVEQVRERRANATQGLGLSTQDDARIRGSAAESVANYVHTRRSRDGVINNPATAAGMRAAVTADLRAQNFSQAQITAALSNDSFLETAAQDAQLNASPEDRTTYDSLISAGQEATAAFAGQTRDALRQGATESRTIAAGRLGASRLSETHQRGLLDLVSSSSESGELRRKLLAATLMERSGDRETRARGVTARAELEAEARRSGKSDEYDSALAAVMQQVNAMASDNSSGTDALAAGYRGMTIEQATEQVTSAGSAAEEAGAKDMAGAVVDSLGSRAASTYLGAGGGEAGARALMQMDPRQVQDTHIREMIEGGSTAAQIAAEVNRAASAGTDAGSGATAEGAGMSEEERANLSGTDAMIAAITEGMGDLPGAARRLDSAAERLERAASAMGGAPLDDGLAAGSGESSGFSVENGRPTLRLGGYNILTI